MLVDRMLGRLRAGAEAELSALGTVENSLSALRTRRWSIGAQTLAAVTIPLSLLFAYFGVSTGDATRDTSIVDLQQHWPIYAGLVALVTSIVLQLRDRRRVPPHGGSTVENCPRSRQPASPLPHTPLFRRRAEHQPQYSTCSRGG